MLVNQITPRERYLYHQIHPLKLFTDVASGFGSLLPLWRHELGLALVVMLLPPTIASALVMRLADLERQRNSAFGHYVVRTMTRSMEVVRLAGMIVMAVGAWQQSVWMIAGGLALIVFGWTRALCTSPRR